jgi:hypothetical protein
MHPSLSNSMRPRQYLSAELSPVNPGAYLRRDVWLPLAPLVRRGKQPFLWLLCLLLLIYATLGRSGAHIGIPIPGSGGGGIFIGDLVLLFGLVTLMFRGGYERFFALPVAWCWLIFFAWNAAQTLPYFSEYGLAPLRDAAVWGYSLFAVIVASQLLARPSGFQILLDRYRVLARFYVPFALIMIPISIAYVPEDVEVFTFGPPVVEHLMTALAGTMAFVACRFVSVPTVWWYALAIEVAAIGTQGRGALLSFVAAAIVVWFFKPWRTRPSMRVIGVAGGLGLMLTATLMLDVNFGVSATGRKLGPNQLLENIEGSFTNTGSKAGGLDGTREWRMKMWNGIIDMTVFGPYFWTGKGYGINIVKDLGHELPGDTRNPENSHLTFLARSGVPGLVLWLVLQFAWATSVLRVLLFARRTGRPRAAGVMVVVLAYWAQLMVFAATGVVFEGPQGGVWFWTIFGVGAAAARMVRRDPDFFERLEYRGAVAAPRRADTSAGVFRPPRFTYPNGQSRNR